MVNFDFGNHISNFGKVLLGNLLFESWMVSPIEGGSPKGFRALRVNLRISNTPKILALFNLLLLSSEVCFVRCICITPSSNISQAYKVNALANDCTSEGGEGLSQRCTNKDKGFSPWGVAESVHLTCLIPHKPTPSFTEHFKRLINLLFVIHPI